MANLFLLSWIKVQTFTKPKKLPYIACHTSSCLLPRTVSRPVLFPAVTLMLLCGLVH